jgi:sulfotransferase famil protein
MLDYNRNIPLISLHIPKCAGTSFERVLKQWFGQRLFLHYHNPTKNQMPKRHNLSHRLFTWRYKRDICIHGHFRSTYGFGVKDYYPQIEQYITILRDPFEQAISNYFFQKKRGQERLVFGKKISVEEEFGDLETYLREVASTIPEYFPPEISLNNYADLLEEKFVYIGLVEDLQTSLNILANKLSKTQTEIPHMNISSRDINLSDESAIWAQFRERNELSYRLYDYARAHYGG